jgi:tetratricopeptide (TPR) repeat protein
MNDRTRSPVFFFRDRVMAAALLCLLAGAMSAAAREPVQEFLEGLRLRGYHDTALAYIDRLATRDDLPQATAQTLGYERAVTLELAAADAKTAAKKAELLDEALTQLKAFLQQYPDQPLATSARFRLGSVLVTRAQLLAEEFRSQGDTPSANELAARARSMYDQAREIYGALQQSLRERLLALPARLDPVADAGLIDERDRLRSRYVEVQLLMTGILQKKADTYAPGSPDYLAALRSAASEYNTVFTKYAPRLVGLYARLYEGRCHQQAGDLDTALAVYKELLDLQTKATPFFDLKTNALKAALECWLDEPHADYAAAVSHGETWLNSAEPTQLENETAAAVVTELARIYRLLAATPASDDAAAGYRRRAEELDRQAADLQQALKAAEKSAPPKRKDAVAGEEPPEQP